MAKKAETVNLGDRQAVVDHERTVDLDAEPVVLADGTVVDEIEAERWAARIVRRGRPSLSGRAGASTRVGARVDKSLEARLAARAEAEHKSTSDVLRDALQAYLS